MTNQFQVGPFPPSGILDESKLRDYFNAKNPDYLGEIADTVNTMHQMGFAYMLLPSTLRGGRLQVSKGVNEIALPHKSGERLLWLNYTPESSTFVSFAELRGNNPGLFSYKGLEKTHLYVSDDCSMNIAGWVVPEESDEGSIWLSLATEACRAFTQDETTMLSVTAQAACENRLNVFWNDWFKERSIGRDKRESFLEEKATYSGQLNVLLRSMATPKVPESLLSVLNRLRGHRNEVAHGKSIPTVDKFEMAESLVAMVFLREFLNCVKIQIRDD